MTTINDLKLYKENGKYYLSALIDHDDKNGYYQISIPKIRLPISHCSINDTSYGACCRTFGVDLGFGELYAEPLGDEEEYYCTITCLEEKVHEMTLAEIERELGYKIKLKENNK